ncbi:MAG TPA: hypothetical protein VGN42_25960 [Pirellulales bacterium]|nr:hypothetical protein [Pirellulales bacterium]
MRRIFAAIESLRRPWAAASVALGLVFQGFLAGSPCRAEGPRALPAAQGDRLSRIAEPAMPLFIESDANTPARLSPAERPSAPPASRRPLMCCRPTQAAAPRNIHPTLAALADAVKPRRQSAADWPATSHRPDREGPAAIEPPAGTNLAPPKLIANPWARPETEKPAEPSQWRTTENRPVRLAKFNEPPPAAAAAVSPPHGGEGKMIAGPAVEQHSIKDPAIEARAITHRAVENLPNDVRETGGNPLRAAANDAAQRPGRWSGLNPLR